ncbi:MAG TPA: sigma-70 family RNA polymerase sigma factor [Polyangia bacterium]|nr:sigma-70 family RNA polymerase sigma factor [Polyangia bacterium]
MELYQRYGPALLRKAARLLGNEADAQDVVQGLFVEMLRRRDMDRDLPYLYRSITNRCLNLLRDSGNRERLLQKQEEALRGPVRVRCDEVVVGVDLVCKLIDRLDEKCGEVLIYRYFDDLTQDEIAELSGTSRKTVGARLARIREAVKELVG